MPGNRPERFAKALASGADAVVLDLEDAVAAGGQGRRARRDRAMVRAQTADADRARIVVRINDAQSTPGSPTTCACCATPRIAA